MLSTNNQLTVGGGSRQRQRGYCRVSEPAMGFFITGSSIEALNGVYVRRNPPRSKAGDSSSTVVLYYEHEEGLWHMSLDTLNADNDVEEEENSDEDDRYFTARQHKKRPEHEWYFLDELGYKRFRHDGDTIIPGAGTRWSHMKRYNTSSIGDMADPLPTATAITEVREDDEEELPWQVIAILDSDMVRQLLWSSEHRKQKVRDAKLGKNAAAPPRASLESAFAPGNWLFQILSPQGATLHIAPDATSDVAGTRKYGDYVKGVKIGISGNWLCLDSSEDLSGDRASLGRVRSDFYFNASYARRQLWLPLDNLREVSAENSAVLDITDVGRLDETSPSAVGDESGGYTDDLFDRPFVPRMEDSESSVAADDTTQRDMDGGIDDEALETITKKPSLSQSLPGAPIGVAVEVTGLMSVTQIIYNGVTGVVVSPKDDNGLQSVRLDSPYSGTLILCSSENLVFIESGDTTASSDVSITNAARLLGIILDPYSKSLTSGRYWGFAGETLAQQIGCALRAALRDIGSEISVGLELAAREAAALLMGSEQVHDRLNTTSADGSDTMGTFCLTPMCLLRTGALGSRAAACMVSAVSPLSAEERGAGILEIRNLLKLEVRRAEKASASVFLSECEDSCGRDELLLRLGLVQALLAARRETEALVEAKGALLFQEARRVKSGSPAVHFLLGRCLLRLGLRLEGIAQLEIAENGRAVSSDEADSTSDWLAPLSEWGRKEASLMLRAHRGSERCRAAALDSYSRGSFEDAGGLYGRALQILELGFVDDKRGRATGYADRAGCHRRARHLDAAIADLDEALRLFPRYSRALFRKAVCLLEAGKAEEAVEGFKDLYRVDREWPMLSEWLVRAFSLRKRQTKGYKGTQEYDEPVSGGAKSAASPSDGLSEADTIAREVDHYTVLGVSTDATEKQLKTAYRMRSLQFHPDRKDGNTAAFQRIAAAYETLSDADKRRAYDEGGDIKVKRGGKDDSDDSEEEDEEHKTTMREEVEREFYPERYNFWPFGDPWVYKRKHMAQKKAKKDASSRPAWGSSADHHDWM